VSFKKMGRLDAVFLRVEGTNVILLATHGQSLTIPKTNLCDLDRSYIENLTELQHPAPPRVSQSAIVRNEMLRRRVEAAKLREDAAADRQAAQIEIEEAGQLESEAALLAGKAADVDSTTNQINADVPDNLLNAPSPAGSCTKSKREATIATGESAQLHEDISQLRRQAQEKRRKAERLQREATQLEQTASAEVNPSLHLSGD